jgi:hypothetical protein
MPVTRISAAAIHDGFSRPTQSYRMPGMAVMLFLLRQSAPFIGKQK